MIWTAHSSPFDVGGNPVRGCYSPALRLCCVVGNVLGHGVIATSPDGSAWTSAATLATIMSDVAWSPALALFAAVGFDTGLGNVAIWTSPDGVTWTPRASPFDGQPGNAVAWSEAQGRFLVGGGNSGDALLTSPDGIVWTAHSSPFDAGTVVGVGYSPALGLWAAVGSDSIGNPLLATSPDGSAWTARTTPFDGAGGTLADVAWLPMAALFLAVGNDAAATMSVATSPDGTVWTTSPCPFDGNNASGACEANGTVLVVGGNPGNSDTIISSPDAATWSAETTPFDGNFCYGIFFAAGTLVVAVGVGGGEDIATAGALPVHTHVQVLAPPWRWVVAFLDPADMTLSSQTLTFLDRLATNQAVTYALNQPAEATMDAPSDNPEVNILRVGGGRPFLSEGNRFLFGFRREGAGSLPRPAGYPADAPWVIRYAGIILQLERETGTDEPVSHITAYDPWMYWTASRPLVLDDGTLPTSSGVSYAGMRGDEIAVAILTNALAAHGPLFADWGQTAFYAGTIEHTDVLDGINVRQGITVGEALTQLVQTGSLDVVLTPIYDLANRPGLVVEVNIYKQAGSRRNGAIFAWDRPSRSLSALDLLHDGIQRANRVLYWASKGLTIGTVKSPTVDTAPTFGQYWLQKSIQDGTPALVGDVLAQTQAQLLRAGKQTLTFDPAPERSPLPWQEYFLGDQVPVYATREHFGEEFDAGVVDGDGHWTNLQRVYVLPLKIGDDEVETVEQILTANPDSID